MTARRYTADLPDGRRVEVDVPPELTFAGPVTADEARAGIAQWIADAVRPSLSPLSRTRRVHRDAAGAITHVTEHPPATPAAMAEEIGRQVAAHIIEGNASRWSEEVPK